MDDDDEVTLVALEKETMDIFFEAGKALRDECSAREVFDEDVYLWALSSSAYLIEMWKRRRKPKQKHLALTEARRRAAKEADKKVQGTLAARILSRPAFPE